jgi:hypothetical protein
MKTINWCTIVWAILLAALFIFTPPLQDALWAFYLPLPYLPVLPAAILLIVTLVRGFRSAWSRTLPALVILVAGLSLLFTSGFALGRRAYFEIRKSHYEEVLAASLRTGTIPENEGRADPSRPKQYALYFQRGFRYHWVGAIYDPFGEVMRVNEAGRYEQLQDSSGEDIHGWFGGILVRAEDVGGGWYLCWFGE